MPYINIRLGCKLNEKQREDLNKKTTHFMNTIMGKRREVTVVHIMESEPNKLKSTDYRRTNRCIR